MKNYSDFYKNVYLKENAYFIGANTGRGFAYADPQLFDEGRYNMLYIIKGGPGTGKSSMMKKIREHFESLGAAATSYYCSSDPTSLDAVIIEKDGLSVGIADGTRPHSLDASLPGAVSQIINLGVHWNTSALKDKYDLIAAFSANKSLAFDSAKAYLSAAAKINAELKKYSYKGFDDAKATKFIRRLLSNLPKQKEKAKKRTVITTAISMKGAFRLPTFDSAKTVMGIMDHDHLAPVFLEKLSEEISGYGHSQYVSYSPLGDITEIYMPFADLAFVPAGNDTAYDKIIRLTRFADKEYFSQNLAKRRFNERCLLEILDGALSSLAEAKKFHFALEDIYVGAMDFDGVDDDCNKIIKETEICLNLF